MCVLRIFISHSSKDKPAAEALAVALRARRIDPWFEKWEISAGDDVVASVNAGLGEAGAAIIAGSRYSRDSRWVETETSYLADARVNEQGILILGDECFVPPLLAPLARLRIRRRP